MSNADVLTVCDMRCEYKRNPIGIDVTNPRFSWKLESHLRGVVQTAYQLQVVAVASPGESSVHHTDDSLFADHRVLWDTGKVASQQSVHVTYSGPPLAPRTRYVYRVRVWDNRGRISNWSSHVTHSDYFETGFLGVDDWTAKWICGDVDDETASPLLRKGFHIAGEIASARLYASSLGVYELTLNGKRVSDWELTPGWTSYDHRLQYQTYDVTSYLSKGENAIGAMLGNGWYMGELGWTDQRNIYGDKRALLMELHVVHRDGTELSIVSDDTWKTHLGPIRMSEVYHGETYDARLEQNGWNLPHYDDSEWSNVSIIDRGYQTLVAQENLPTKVTEELHPVELITTPRGETVCDMGQNMVGWIRFSITAPTGTELVLKHAEVLDRDGNFYTGNLRKAEQTIRYISNGDSEQVYHPYFTFQGFRYVQIEGLTDDVVLHEFVGCVVHTDMEQTGSFESSSPLLNRLQMNILWGQRGNFVDVPTDCPQRDERLGWTGDAQVFIRTAAFNMGVQPFFAKWLHDLAVDQFDSGAVPHVIPDVFHRDPQGGSAAWSDAATICPWTIYQCYGDNRLLEEQYQSMKAWVEYMRTQGDDEHLFNTGFHFGDWLGLDAHEGSYKGATAEDFIATAYYAYSTRLLTRTAQVLGKTQDVRRYTDLAEKVVQRFRQEFVTETGRLAVPTQTAHVVALHFDLLEERHRERAARTLAKMIEDNGGHLSTGFVGTPYLCHVLSRFGYNDLAYQLVLRTDYPSWLYPVTKGATTIWEHWDGMKEDGTFWSDDMNSFNHYAYGSVGEWLYRVAAGLDADDSVPGYQKLHIHPQPGMGLKFAKASFESMYGRVESGWRVDEGSSKMCIEVTVPPNTTATIDLPMADEGDVTESGLPLRDVDGITSVTVKDGGLRLEAESGAYRFACPVQNAVGVE